MRARGNRNFRALMATIRRKPAIMANKNDIGEHASARVWPPQEARRRGISWLRRPYSASQSTERQKSEQVTLLGARARL